MTDDEVRAVVSRYSTVMLTETRGDNTVFMAYYIEAPVCLVEAATRDGVLAELDALIVPVLQSIIADGGRLPQPRRQAAVTPLTNEIVVSGIVAGGPPSTIPAQIPAQAFDPPEVREVHGSQLELVG